MAKSTANKKCHFFKEMEEKKHINWETVDSASRKGKLADLLKTSDYPPSLWEEQDPDGWALIHFASAFKNNDALIMLINNGCDLEKRTNQGNPPIHFASNQISTLKIFCAAGANMYVTVETRYSLIYSLIYIPPFSNNLNAAKVLVANGMRLNYLRRRHTIPLPLVLFEQGFLRCKSVIVTLLGLKKRRHHLLIKLDRFLIQQELAVAIWATRHTDGNEEKAWQKNL